MKFNCLGGTDPGLVRSNNQDDYYIDPHYRYCIVADGMGGHAGGQEASHIATTAIHTYLDEHWDSQEQSPKLLENAFLKANEAILHDQNQHPERADMGTTGVMFLYRQGEFWFANVGDSRFYLLRQTKLTQVSDDHTWVARAAKAGELTADQAKNHPWRHVLSQCLGRKDLKQIDINTIDVQDGDRLLLCSDGLSEEVDDAAIAQILSSPQEQIIPSLIQAAKDNGGKDNITVVLVSVQQ